LGAPFSGDLLRELHGSRNGDVARLERSRQCRTESE
jgi:hypothetical protein